jgi:predicted Zn-dependent protease
LRGTLDLREGKLPEAEDALRQSIHLDPAMAQARLQLVNLFMQQGRKQDAATQLHEFLMAFPASPLAQQAKNLLHRLETADSVSQ